MLSPRYGLNIGLMTTGLGLGLMHVMTSVSYSLASSPRFLFQYAIPAPLLKRVLCAPASSALVKRVFSQSGLIVRPTRARMNDKMLEELVFLKCNDDVRTVMMSRET